MADNFTFTPGSGATAAADDIGGGLLAIRHKVIHGIDGSNDGDTAIANGLPVSGARANYNALVRVSITNSYASAGLTIVSTSRSVYLYNGSNTNIRLSWDGGTTLHHVIISQTARLIPIKVGATQLHVRDDGVNWISGTLDIEVLG